MARRFIYVVLDGVGIGALPDAAAYDDEGSDTLGNLSRVVPLHLPFLQSLGLGNIAPLQGMPPVGAPLALAGRLAPASAGKDSTVGHWEQMGLVTATPFPTFPEGFPQRMIGEFANRIGVEVLGNRTASGTEIILELGDQHVASGRPIVYTSADSVFQIAAHVDIVPLESLYSWCQIARELFVGEDGVARVIARPFSGSSGSYARTPERRDFSIPPPGPTYLSALRDAGVRVVAVGKVSELFAGTGVTETAKFASNHDNLTYLAAMVAEQRGEGDEQATLIITNLVDFDTAWGHRNDIEGFARGLKETDGSLEAIAASLGPEDLLLVTADHGVDPTTDSTDHSREFVPLLLYPRPQGTPQAVYEGGFADAGATAFEYLTGRNPELQGTSVLALKPGRGWRHYTAVQNVQAGTVAGVPGRVGPQESAAAARWLADNIGPAPEVAVVMGSGLSAAGLGEPEAEVAYRAIPGWCVGEVAGHPYVLAMAALNGGRRLAVLRGRVHEYEGFDLSEVQLPIRSLAAWGVAKVVLTSAAGAVADGLAAGSVVVVERVIDLQYRDMQSRPVELEATPSRLVAAMGANAPGGYLHTGSHASVPGPQYETPSELALLRELGVATVSMTPAAELRAAGDEDLQVATMTLVTNAGETTHTEVLAAAERAAASLGESLDALLKVWA